MSVVTDLRGREVLDSRGYPTVEAEVRLESGVRARAMVPSGASTGRHEALELRDGDPARYRGRGVRKAVAGLSGEIREALEGMEAGDQAAVDRRLVELDGTDSKERLGANALLAASMAVARAAAWETGRPLYRHLHSLRQGADPTLPVPLVNVLNGGSHAPNSLEIQEFMVVPVGFRRFSRALRAGVEVFHVLRERLAEEGHATAVGDEGGVAPDLASNEEALDYLMAAVEAAGYRPGEEIALALDCAASEFHDVAEGVYRPEEGDPPVGTEELVDLYHDWSRRYPLVSLEDGLAEDDWEGWVLLTERLGEQLQIVGDDLFVTNVDRIRRGIRKGAANALLVKLNQIGTVSETLDAMAVAREAGYANVVSHRSGETEDTFIADLAVGTAAGQIKTGSTSRSERVAKYNRLLRIQEELGESAGYAGRDAFGTEAVRG